MSALACFLKDLGHDVKGCDVNRYIFSQDNLDNHNIIYEDINNYNYQGYDYVILGNAFKTPKILEKLKKDNKTILTYQEVIKEIVNNNHSIAICGTHGKTTTSHMINTILDNNDCSCIIGDGYGIAKKQAKHFIFEACEYQDNFLNYNPDIIVLTNVDFDHVDYFKNQEQYNQSFINFLNQAKDFIILNNDDRNSVLIKNKITKKIYSYGINNASDVMAYNVIYDTTGVTFSIKYKDNNYENLHLNIYGKHLFYDALATISLGLILNESIENIIERLNNFKPAKRRFNIYQKHNNVIVDDYGHHPKEINLTIQSIKQKFPAKSLIIVFFPDRSSRIEYFFNEYIEVFKKATKTYIIPFINLQKESIEEKLLQSFCKHQSITIYDDSIYNRSYDNTVFLFTGSKDTKKYIQRLLENI